MRLLPTPFSTEMVRAILDGRKNRRKLYVRKGESPLSPEHLAQRLANALDDAQEGSCWEWKRTKNYYGYGTLTVNGKTIFAHRLAYQLGVGDIPTGLQVLHSCDNPSCINPQHLHLGTGSDNMKECYDRGRSKIKPVSFKGESNGSAKLSKKDVVVIKSLIAHGEKQHKVAAEFNISQAQVSNIVLGKGWSHV